MELSDKIKRWIVFYFSAALFILLLPVILSYSLGYNIDFRSFKIYNTGIIYLKSQPAGASVYINGKLSKDTTPTRIEELKPGPYSVEVRREGFYPWQKELVVRPNMVTKAEEIVLFPLSRDLGRISSLDIIAFAVSNKGLIYYMAKNGLARSNMDGTTLKKLSSYSGWPEHIKGIELSPDQDKLMYFDERHIWVAYLNLDKVAEGDENAKVEEVLKSESDISRVFWFSQSNYLVFVADKEINVVELSGQGVRNIVTLYKFNSQPRNIYYDANNDSLYFTDNIKTPDTAGGFSLERLNLRKKFFDQLMQTLNSKKKPV